MNEIPAEYQKVKDAFKNLTPPKQHDDIFMDGALCWDTWVSQPVKILFYYKETYGYRACGSRLFADEYHQWVDDDIRTTKKILALGWAILERIGGKAIDARALWSAFCDKSLLHSMIPKIAHSNVNKLSGDRSRSHDGNIREASRQHAEPLKRQLEYLNPDIIICGGTVTWHSLIHDTGLFQGVTDVLKPGYAYSKGKVLCHLNHVCMLGVRTTLFEYSRLVSEGWMMMK